MSMDGKKQAISVAINLEGLDPSVKKQVKALLEERDKFKNKYLKWKRGITNLIDGISSFRRCIKRI